LQWDKQQMVGYTKARTTYERPGLGETDDADPFKAADLSLTIKISSKLQEQFPGHAWMVEVSHAQGCAFVSIPLFTGRHKYVIHINSLKTDPQLHTITRAGGEILERYRIPRCRFGLDDFLSALEGIPKHLRAHHGLLKG